MRTSGSDKIRLPLYQRISETGSLSTGGVTLHDRTACPPTKLVLGGSECDPVLPPETVIKDEIEIMISFSFYGVCVESEPTWNTLLCCLYREITRM